MCQHQTGCERRVTVCPTSRLRKALCGGLRCVACTVAWIPDHGSVVCCWAHLAMPTVRARLLWVIHVGADGAVRSQMLQMDWVRGSRSARKEFKLRFVVAITNVELKVTHWSAELWKSGCVRMKWITLSALRWRVLWGRGTRSGGGPMGCGVLGRARTSLGPVSSTRGGRARDGGGVGVGCFENAAGTEGRVKGAPLLAGWPWEKG